VEDDDCGNTWQPTFEGNAIDFGALAGRRRSGHVYVGSGEACGGPDFVDWATACTNPRTGAKPGVTWACATGNSFGSIIVDPKNPDRLFVAVLGHPYGPSAERGIFRSLDGGQVLQKSCSKNDDVGGIDSPSIHANSNKISIALGVAASAWTVGGTTKVRGADCSNPKTGARTGVS